MASSVCTSSAEARLLNVYIKPLASLEADIFVMLPSQDDCTSPSLTPIYDYLATHGVATRETLTIGNWPVKFSSVVNELEHEAIDEAVETEIGGVKTWIMTAEHLVALALRSSRPEDLALISQFMESGKVDGNKLQYLT